VKELPKPLNVNFVYMTSIPILSLKLIFTSVPLFSNLTISPFHILFLVLKFNIMSFFFQIYLFFYIHPLFWFLKTNLQPHVLFSNLILLCVILLNTKCKLLFYSSTTTALGAKIFKKYCSSFATLVSMEDILIEKIGKEIVRNKWGGCCVLLNQSPTCQN
jgi:hypothetical protein